MHEIQNQDVEERLNYFSSPEKIIIYDEYIIIGLEEIDKLYGLYVLDKYSGELVWYFDKGSNQFIIKDSLLYVATDNLYCLDLESGNMVWEYSSKAYYNNYPIIIDDKIYIESAVVHDDYIYVIDSKTGHEIEKINAYGHQYFDEQNNLIFYSDKEIALNRAENTSKLLAYNPIKNVIIWSIPNFYGHDLYTTNNSFMYVKRDNISSTQAIDSLFCHDLTSGKLIWEYQSGTNWIWSIPLSIDDLVYIIDETSFTCLSSNSGNEIWKIQHGNMDLRVFPIHHNEYVILSFQYENIMKLYHKDSGEFIKEIKIEHPLTKKPVIEEDKIYYMSGFTLYCEDIDLE